MHNLAVSVKEERASSSTVVPAGFFGRLGSDSTVENLGVENASVAAESIGYNCAGGIAGYNSSTATACYWSGIDGGTGGGSLTDSYKVAGSDWSSAMTAMNQQLASDNVGWQYEKNGSGTTEPLTLKKSG